MRRWLIRLLAVSSIVLAGCATKTIRSDVTAFHEWPDTLPDKSYVFERTRDQSNNLEYLSYEKLVRAELHRLGFHEASASARPTLNASISYSINSRDVREIYPVVVGSYPYPYWPGPAWRGHYSPFGPYGPYSPFYSPFHDPFWYGPPVVEQRVTQYQVYTRELKVTLARRSDGKRLFETTVRSEGNNGSLAAVMPYLVRSAFSEFPGPSGVPRRIELKMEK